MKDGGFEAAGAVIGDVTALATSNSKYKGGQRGRAIGGGVGTAIGTAIGVPGVGQAVGSLVGGLIGGASDKKKMIEDYDEVASKRYQTLNLNTNVNPYGAADYMEEGGMAGMASSLGMGALGALGELTDTTETENLIDAMMGKLPRTFRKGGVVKKGYHRMPDGSVMPNSKMYAYGGVIGGEDPVKPVTPAKYLNQKEVDADVNVAKGILTRQNADPYFINNVKVGYVGDPKIKFVGDTNQATINRATTLPKDISFDMLENTSEGYGYYHPQEGTFIPVDMQAITMKYGKKTATKPIADMAKLKDGGLIGDPPVKKEPPSVYKINPVTRKLNPKYNFPAYDYEVSNKDKQEYDRMYNDAAADTTGFYNNMVAPAWGSYASGTSSRSGDVQKGRLKTALLRQNILDDAKAGLKESTYNQFTAFPVSKKPLKDGGMIKKYADGGLTEGGGDPVRELINIEKGEILIDPVTLDVIREYENPNRYKKHEKNPQKEPIGNFTMIEEGKVVIPKKYAERYKKGDILTRKSIVGEILKNQMLNPDQNDPRMTTDARYAQAGIVSGGGERKGKAMAFDWTNNIVIPGGKPRYPIAGIADTAVDGLPQFPAGATGAQLPVYDDQVDVAAVNAQAEIDMPWKLPKSLEITAPAGSVSDPRVQTPVNKKMIASKIMGALPTAFGITNALGIDPYLKYDENTQFDTAKAYVGGMETEPNIDASLGAIRRTNANRNKMLNNFNSPSVRAEVASNQEALLGAEAGVIQNKENLAMELRNRKRETLGNLEVAQGANRLDMRRQLMNELRMDKANRENLVHQGISEGATNFQKSVMDEERIKALNSVAEFYNIDPYSASLLVDQHAFMPYVTDALAKLSGNIPGTGTTKMAPSAEIGSVTRDRVGNVKTSKKTVVKKPTKG